MNEARRAGAGRAIAIALLLSILAVSATAATLRDPRIERIGVENGLPDGTVYSIALDAEGFLWFGTANGLARYDGYGFTIYTHDPADPHAISTNLASHAFTDRQGRLWIGTWGGGLERYDPAIDGFVHYPARDGGLRDSRIQSLFEDRDGALWLGLFAGGLQRLDPESGKLTTWGHDPADPATLSDERVWAIAQDMSGDLWVATSRGLDRLDPSSGIVTRNALCGTDTQCLPHPEVRAILIDGEGSLWIGTRDGLMFVERGGARRTWREGEAGLPSSIINTIYRDRTGRIWIGTTYGGLALREPGSDSFRAFRYEGDDPNSLSNDDVRSIIEDQAGLLWIGTRGEGVSKLDPATPFTRYRYNPDDPEGGLAHPRVWAVATDPRGRIWAGTSAGLERIDRESRTILHLRHDPSRPNGIAPGEVRVLHVDDAGTLWVGTQDSWLQRLVTDGDRPEETWFETIPPRELEGSRATVIEGGAGGSFFVGTRIGVVSMVSDGRVLLALRSGSDPSFQLQEDGVTSLEFDGEHTLWIGTQGTGLFRYDIESRAFTQYRFDAVDVETLSRNDVSALLLAGDGMLWVGTRGGGLNRLDPKTGRFRRFSTSDGLPNNVVHSIVQDEAGFVWMGTNLGLSRFDPATGRFRNFDVTDGIQGSSFLAGSVHRASWNEIFFGGVNGLTSFFPSEVRNVNGSFVPPVRITAVRLFGREIETKGPVWATRSIVLGPRDDYLSIEFAVLDYTNPPRNRFSYRLEGFDRDWVDAGSRRDANYTNLDGGDYVFRVRGANHLGAWNEEGATLTIRVVPPLIERLWFQVVVVLSVVGLLWLSFRLRLRGIRRARQRLETLVQERTAELEAKTVELEHAKQAAEEVSYTDALTSLRNRHFLRDTIDHDIARVVREYESRARRGEAMPPERTDLLFVLADLDRFKLVNDTSGHRAGDRVLAQMGALFQKRCRESDLVIRWGGEEFLILYRSVDRGQAPTLVEQLRLAVEQDLFDLGDGTLQKMTCSFGFAAFPFDTLHPRELDWERVLELADQALYESKRSGRNTWTGIAPGPKRTSSEMGGEVRGRIAELIERQELAWIRRQA